MTNPPRGLVPWRRGFPEEGNSMTHQEIMELIAAFDKSTLDGMKLTQADFSMELTRSGMRPMEPRQLTASPEATHTAATPGDNAPDTITAPLVGTFYTASAPDQPPFVNVGDRVEKGQTVGLIEAMKMMSEVTAPCDCIIEEALVKNAELVAFGTPLFSYKPC